MALLSQQTVNSYIVYYKERRTVCIGIAAPLVRNGCTGQIGISAPLGRNLHWGFTSVDGSKFSACNSKNNNFTKNKLDDRVKCLEFGIIPHVITDDGKDGYEIETAYEESEVNVKSTSPEELKKALHAGVVPDAYKDVIT